MTTNSAQILSTMLAQLGHVHIAAGKIQKSLGAIRTAALGAGAVFAGWAVIKGLYDATKHAEKLNHELVKLQTGARLSDVDTKRAETLAFDVSRDVRGTDVAHNVKMQRELFGVFGDMNTARELLPLVAQGSRAVSAFVDKDTDLAQIAVRALELRGHITKDHKIDAASFKAEFESMVRSIVASEGLIDPAKLLQFIQQAGPSARMMNGDEFWGKVPAIMNALGASKSGTATMSLFSQMIGHVVAGQRVAIAMEEAGMLTPGKWKVERGGKVRMDQDAVPDQAGFMDHPMTWLHDKMTALRERKDKDGKPLDEVGIMQRLFQFSSRATTARLISDLDANWPIILNEERRFKQMPGPEQITKEQNAQDLSVNVHNLNEAWGNFMAALGGPGIPIMIGVLTKLTDTLNALQAATVNHPEVAAALFQLAGGIAALTALGGALVLFNVAMSPFVAGVRLLIGVGTTAAAAGAGLTALATGIIGLAGPIAALAGIAKLGSDAETPANRAAVDALKKLRRSPDGGPNGPTHDGFGPDGRPETIPNTGKRSSLDSPGLHYVVVTNPEDLSLNMARRFENGASRPQSGPSFQDYRMSLPQPGLGAVG